MVCSLYSVLILSFLMFLIIAPFVGRNKALYINILQSFCAPVLEARIDFVLCSIDKSEPRLISIFKISWN